MNSPNWRRTIGLWLAPVAMVAVWHLPLGLEPRTQRFAAVFTAILVAWLTEVVPIAATALLIAPLMIAADVTDAKTAFAPYADPLLFLFIGGFFIAKAMARHGLDRRLARALLFGPLVGGRSRRVPIAVMFAGALLSMWISNTASAALLLPIVLLLLKHQRERTQERGLLLLAYTCSVAGLMTPVGTPTNLITMRLLASAGVQVTFFGWVKLALPAALVLLAAIYVWLMLVPVRSHARDEVAGEVVIEKVSAGWNRGELVTLLAFGCALVGWFTPPVLRLMGSAAADDWQRLLSPGAVAILASSLLFLVHIKGESALPWSEAIHIDWGIVLLFGGGLSLGAQMIDTGFARILGDGLITVTGVRGLWLVTTIFVLFTLFFTEVCSNMASASMLVPIAIATAEQLGLPVAPPVLGVGLAASCAFMMPIATGPNAVIYSTGKIPFGHMLRTGFVLNLVSAAMIVLVLRLLCPLYGWS